MLSKEFYWLTVFSHFQYDREKLESGRSIHGMQTLQQDQYFAQTAGQTWSGLAPVEFKTHRAPRFCKICAWGEAGCSGLQTDFWMLRFLDFCEWIIRSTLSRLESKFVWISAYPDFEFLRTESQQNGALDWLQWTLESQNSKIFAILDPYGRISNNFFRMMNSWEFWGHRDF